MLLHAGQKRKPVAFNQETTSANGLQRFRIETPTKPGGRAILMAGEMMRFGDSQSLRLWSAIPILSMVLVLAAGSPGGGPVPVSPAKSDSAGSAPIPTALASVKEAFPPPDFSEMSFAETPGFPRPGHGRRIDRPPRPLSV